MEEKKEFATPGRLALKADREIKRLSKEKYDALSRIQTTDNLNDVSVLLEEPVSGTYHNYVISRTDNNKVLQHIQFQKGPRKERGSKEGVLDVDLLEIVRDRLKCFQTGDFACKENEKALIAVEDALYWLYYRVEDRKNRGVLGKNEE